MGHYGSFGAGFTQGIKTGSTLAESWVDNYKKKKEDEVQNLLFTQAYESQQVMNQATGEMESIQAPIEALKNMSPEEMNGWALNTIRASGKKINGDIDEVVTGFTNNLFNMFQTEKMADIKYKKGLVGLASAEQKLANLKAKQAQRNSLTGGYTPQGQQGGQPVQQGGTPQTGGIMTQAQFFKSKNIKPWQGRYSQDAIKMYESYKKEAEKKANSGKWGLTKEDMEYAKKYKFPVENAEDVKLLKKARQKTAQSVAISANKKASGSASIAESLANGVPEAETKTPAASNGKPSAPPSNLPSGSTGGYWKFGKDNKWHYIFKLNGETKMI